MPFYFKDLKDNTLIHFRAYVDGISDTISPSWSGQNYIGRSEPVYTYSNSEREIAFTLKLFAQTKDEFNAIYKKMDFVFDMVRTERTTSFRFRRFREFMTHFFNHELMI